MAAPQYADISSWQGTIDWATYKTWSSMIAMKATEGTGYVDPRYRANRSGAESAGLRIVHYHYGRPDLNAASAEAAWFFQTVGNVGDGLIMLDYEQDTPAATAEWAYEWLVAARQLFGVTPTIYASDSYVRAHLQDPRLAQFPLILANWTFDPAARPACPPPWSTYLAIQWTDKAQIPGISTPVDANVFLGGNMQQYSTSSADFGAWFAALDADHWQCKQNGHIVQYGIKAFFSQLSMDGQSLPLVGLPLTNEIYLPAGNGKQVVLQIFERAAVLYDPAHAKDTQPGTGAFSLCHITDPDFLNYAPGMPTPQPMPNVSDAVAQLQAAISASNTVGSLLSRVLVDLKQ